MNDTKICPNCGKEIKAVAKKCRYCGMWLDDANSQANQSHLTTPSAKSNTLKYLLFGIGLIILIAVIIIFINGSSSSDYPTDEPSYSNTSNELIEEVPIEGNPIKEVPEYILTHEADGNGVWVKNPDYIDGSHLYDGTEDGD